MGNPGNAGELSGSSAGGNGPDVFVGGVPYEYRIGKYEVTNAQYVKFLNAVDPTGTDALELYSDSMSSDRNGGINYTAGASKGSKYEVKPGRNRHPVVFVSWYDAVRFANWLHNGQGSGDTETGAYTVNDGPRMRRNPDARWALPTEDKWYKAAYHKNDGITGNYWDYPTSTDEVPYSDQPPGRDAPTPSNTANFFKDDSTANGYDDGVAATASPSFDEPYVVATLTEVGAYARSASPYGTFDQGGNVAELTEALITHVEASGKEVVTRHSTRGGMWTHDSNCMAASFRGCGHSRDRPDVGFRVVSVAFVQ